jgi:hypothetical protein
VATEIVHNDDVAWTKRWKEDLLDMEAGTLAIDWPLEKPWCLDPVVGQGGQEGHGLPAAVRDPGGKPLDTGRPSPQSCHIGPGPGLVDEDQALRFERDLDIGSTELAVWRRPDYRVCQPSRFF